MSIADELRVELQEELQNVNRSNEIIDSIHRLPWENLVKQEVIRVARAYYFFSVQFRENLEIACSLWPDDEGLVRLYGEECNTDNLSPWPGIAAPCERLNHDEFIKRLLALEPTDDAARLDAAGHAYLAVTRGFDDVTRAQSIIGYEDGGLSKVFEAMLRAPCWDGPGALAFKFFLEQHIQFDKNEGAGHGAMVRHIKTTCDVSPLWAAFRQILVSSVTRAFERTGEVHRREPQSRQPISNGGPDQRHLVAVTI